MGRSIYKIDSIERGERMLDIALSFGITGALIDSSRIDDSNLRNILPGKSVIVESDGNGLVAIYAPGHEIPFYTTRN